MFDNVAEGYDRTNAVATMGLEKHYWRPETFKEIAPRKGMKILDLAAGTGASSIHLREAGAEVVSCDFSVGMLRVGKRRHPELDLIAGDALRLPFTDDTFDVVTISWALRNVNDVTVAGMSSPTGGGLSLKGSGIVSAQNGSASRLPFTATMYIGFTWMWNGWRMLFMLTIVHSSTALSATICVIAFFDWNGMYVFGAPGLGDDALPSEPSA